MEDGSLEEATGQLVRVIHSKHFWAEKKAAARGGPHAGGAITAYPDEDLRMERWLPVADYEGLYEVSNLGRVRSLDRIVSQVNRWGSVSQHPVRGRVLCPVALGPYLGVHLSNREKHTELVHLLVLEAFEGTCPEGQEARHGPGGSRDNRWPENLCYGTHARNCGEDKRRDGTAQIGSRNGRAKLTEDIVGRMLARQAADHVSQRVLAAEFGVGKSTVGRVLRGEAWQVVSIRNPV